ncbi:unnamed protein product [Boreogadus saida]
MKLIRLPVIRSVLTPVTLPSVCLLSASSPPVSLPSVSLLSASSPPSPPKMQGEGKDAYDDNIHYPILLTLTWGPLPPPLGHTQ